MGPASGNSQNRKPKHTKLLVAFAAIALIILLGWTFYRSSQFHITGTESNLNQVASIAPYLKINFNKPLSTQGLSVSSSPSVIGSSVVNGDVLMLSFKQNTLSTQTSYTITIASVFDTSGTRLTDQKLTFTPKSIAYNNLPKDQQQAIVNAQDKYPYAVNTIWYVNTNSLLTYGVTAAQLSNLQQAFFNFSTSIGKQYQKITLGSISVVPHDPNSASTVSSITFTALLDTDQFNARIDYSNLNDIELYLFNPQTDAQVYDSGLITNPS